MTRVVATCTTLPDRYNHLYKTLKSLHAQTIKFDAIYLTLPYRAKRLNKAYPELPQKIKQLCTVIRSDVDYGPITKMYGALISEPDPDTIIISIDDDNIYDTHLVEVLIEKSKIYPNAAICGTGWLLKYGVLFFSMKTSLKFVAQFNGFVGMNVPNTGRKLDVIQGAAGVLYKRSHFPSSKKLYDDLLYYVMIDDDLFKNDDVLISAFLCKNNISRYTFNDIPLTITPDVKEDALSFNYGKMFLSLSKALEKCKAYKLFTRFEDNSISDSPTFKIIAILVIIIFIIIGAYTLYYST